MAKRVTVVVSFLLLSEATAFLVPHSDWLIVTGRSGDLKLLDDLKSVETPQTDRAVDDDLSMFEVLAGNVAQCLVLSDLKRNKSNDGASTGWTGWVDEASAFRLQRCIDRMELALSEDPSCADAELLERRDESQRWIRWMKTCPSPMILELSNELRQAVNNTLDDTSLQCIDISREDFLQRIACRVMLLPSGSALRTPLRTPPGAMAYGKLLYGGVRRYRLIGSTVKRRAGERSLVYEPGLSAWMQYGGPERNFEALDVGSCALLEVIVAPRGMPLPLAVSTYSTEMTLGEIQWDPHSMFNCYSEEDVPAPQSNSKNIPAFDMGSEEKMNELWETAFSSSVGGLQSQVEAIVRRVMDGRVIRPLHEVENVAATHQTRILEAQALSDMGLKPVRGLLLYGPPGCGKTLLAREISRCLDARPPKIVAAPELLDRWVGGSEKRVRELFQDAEMELRQCNGDVSKSALHVIVIDEIDAVFRRRNAAEDSGEATRASAVNQILAKLDGVHLLENVLLIGMTNRKELLDPALLRPGRLEVQVKIPLPDREGRREVLQIHFEALRRRGRLSKPLCQAVDGVNIHADGDSVMSFREHLVASIYAYPSSQKRIRDLAADRWTGGFSGADLAGLVRCAGSVALSRARADGGGIESLLITLEDVRKALKEVRE